MRRRLWGRRGHGIDGGDVGEATPLFFYGGDAGERDERAAGGADGLAGGIRIRGRVWGRRAGSAGEYGDGGGAVRPDGDPVCAGGVLYGRFRQSKSTKFLGRLFIAIMIPLGNFGPRLAEETSRPSVESVAVAMTFTSFE